MTYVPRTGKDGTVTINGQELPITGWSVGPSAVVPSFINSKTGQHPQRLATFDDGGRFTIDFDWDDSNQPFATAGAYGAIRPGAHLTNVFLRIDGPAGTLYWNYPSAIVEGTPQSMNVEGKIVTRISCLADGQYAAPGGALA